MINPPKEAEESVRDLAAAVLGNKQPTWHGTIRMAQAGLVVDVTGEWTWEHKMLPGIGVLSERTLVKGDKITVIE